MPMSQVSKTNLHCDMQAANQNTCEVLSGKIVAINRLQTKDQFRRTHNARHVHGLSLLQHTSTAALLHKAFLHSNNAWKWDCAKKHTRTVAALGSAAKQGV